MMDEAAIRARIRTMVETGALPCDEPEKTWAGKGGGTHCAVCGQLISLTEVEFEVDVAGTTLLLHRLCHQFWLEECQPIKGRRPNLIPADRLRRSPQRLICRSVFHPPGLGAVVEGMVRQGFDVALTRNGDAGWCALFYPSSFIHESRAGSA